MTAGEDVMSEQIANRLPHCTAINRVPTDKPAAKAKCGRCHTALFSGHPVAATSRASRPHRAQRHPGRGRLLGGMVRAVPRDGAGLRARGRRARARYRFLKVDTEAEQQLRPSTNPQHPDAHAVPRRQGRRAARRRVGCAVLRAWIEQNAGGTGSAGDNDVMLARV
jgi:thioredoxin 2